MTVYEGSILCCDEAGTVARFLVEDGGRILHIGDSLPATWASAPRTRLGDKALLPAFGDTHIHFMSYALFSAGLELRAATDIRSSLEMVGAFVRERDPAFVLGFGASANSVRERRLLTRADLDTVCPKRPAFIVKYDGHAGIANSALVKILAPKLGTATGFDAETGLMTQDAFFRATDYATGKVSIPATLGNMLEAVDRLAGYGIGMIHSVTGVGFPLDMDLTLESIFARGLRNPLQYRIFFQSMDVDKARRRGLPRIGGCFATALDGCFGSVDAALLEPYGSNLKAADPDAAGTAGSPASGDNRGRLYYDDRRIREFCIRANRAGLQIEMHAIGDAAFVQATAALDAALADFPREDHRHTIIHACLTTDAGLDICARRGIHLAIQPAFLSWDLEPQDYLESILGDRAAKISPLRTMTDRGIVMAGGSDAPCTIPDPLVGIRAACNHPVAGQSLTVQEALDLYTRNAARISFDEKERGSLEKGKVADMVLLNANPRDLGPSRLDRLAVENLILEGKPYRPGQRRLDLLRRGLSGRRRKI